MTRRVLRILFLFSFAAAGAPAIAAPQSAPAAPAPASATRPSSTWPSPLTWIVSWAASQQIPEPQNALPADDLRDATLRQIVHLSLGGAALRVHLSNAFGMQALHFTSVHIAHPLSPASPVIDPATDKALTFSGQPDVTVPPGAEFVSDPVPMSVAPLSDLAVTFHFDAPPMPETGHPGSRSTSYYIHGDLVSAADLPTAKHIDHWYQISTIDVLANAGAASIVALGDSITDGHATTTNGNDRWTDVLAARLASAAPPLAIGVSNQGIGGNHLLTDGLGPNALARFDRDVLAQAGVRWLIVFEGVNDLGKLARGEDIPGGVATAPDHPEIDHTDIDHPDNDHANLVARILAAYQQIILRARAHGIRVYGATITPFAGSDYYHPDARIEADRQAVNAWIRAPGHFDAVIDFDAVVRDPANPDHLLPAFDCGDHLHPSPAGYRVMGMAIPLDLFAQ
jgi:lysophospholipase L1-like esterase